MNSNNAELQIVTKNLSTFAQVIENKVTQQKGLFSNKFFKKNEVLCVFGSNEILNTPNYLTLQIDDEKHITLHPSFLQYTNHSCNPNVFFDTSTFKLVALQNIAVGDELTFFYPSTEWKMQQAFKCNCGYKNCLKEIKGAAFLSSTVLLKYKLNQYILNKLHQ